jgi:hypothetical protein
VCGVWPHSIFTSSLSPSLSSPSLFSSSFLFPFLSFSFSCSLSFSFSLFSYSFVSFSLGFFLSLSLVLFLSFFSFSALSFPSFFFEAKEAESLEAIGKTRMLERDLEEALGKLAAAAVTPGVASSASAVVPAPSANTLRTLRVHDCDQEQWVHIQDEVARGMRGLGGEYKDVTDYMRVLPWHTVRRHTVAYGEITTEYATGDALLCCASENGAACLAESLRDSGCLGRKLRVGIMDAEWLGHVHAVKRRAGSQVHTGSDRLS